MAAEKPLRRRVAARIAAACLALVAPAPAGAEQILLVSPLHDRNDRIDAILAAARPAISLQRVGLLRFGKPQLWGRSRSETRAARLVDAKLVILEAAHRNALADVATDARGDLLETLPGWVRRGGQLLVVGGTPSFETYAGSPLAEILPVVPLRDEDAAAFRRPVRRELSGDYGKGRQVRHVHPVARTRGNVIIRAGSLPFAVSRDVGRGRVIAVLGGSHEYDAPDAGPDETRFFSSPEWVRFILDSAGSALERTFDSPVLPDPRQLSIPVARTGARIRSEYWFPDVRGGTLSLRTTSELAIWSGRPDRDGWFTLPQELRHGVYQAHWRGALRSRRRAVRIGGPADVEGFDIRFFSLSHGPNPSGLAPGEAHARARELAEAGITSVVFRNHWGERRQSQRDIRALREIVGAGLEIVYNHSLRREHYPNGWPFDGPPPPRVKNLEGEDVAWDIHDERFRAAVDELLDVVGEVRALPLVRALQVIEEYPDGGVTSVSLQGEMREAGLRGDERPGQSGWYEHEWIRSRATAETFRRFRRMAHRFLPGVPQASYWPGSYWTAPRVYAVRVPDFSPAVDEFLGPGYGYIDQPFDNGWLSVVRSAGEIFAARGHAPSAGQGTAVYALGRNLHAHTPRVGPSTWRDTAWTALAHGATMLAYFGLPYGDALAPLKALHDEMFRIGPWIAAAPRTPAAVAVLASWTTRTTGSDEQMRRHGTCLSVLHARLAQRLEEVDLLLEEQAGSPPAELRAVLVAAAPLLTSQTVADLNAFAENGGLLLVDAGAGRGSPQGPRASDPWARARAAGGLHVVDFGIGCGLGIDVVAAQLANRGIQAVSGTPEPRSEARLRGDREIRYWLLLNHDDEPASVEATARIDPSRYRWRDLRGGGALDPPPGPRFELERRVGPRDAAVFLGVRRPAASLALAATAALDRVEIELSVRDAAGEPVADGYPVRLRVRDGNGDPLLHPNARSRVTRGGRARWTLPIQVTAADDEWSVTAVEPVSQRTRHTSVRVAALGGKTNDGDGE